MSETLEYKGWRPLRFNGPDFDALVPCKPTRFFDHMSYIGDHSTCCFLLETAKGLVLLDCMWDNDHCLQMLTEGFAALGHSLEELKHIVITHAHEDHWGHAKLLREKYGCKIYLGRIDNEYGKHVDQVPGLPHIKDMDWDADILLDDGDILDFGDTKFQCILTPGHTPGCMSYIIDVQDAGEPHKVLIFGGSGVMPWTDPDEFIASTDKFEKLCLAQNVDCYISNHPYIDLAYYKLDLINNMVDGVNNPFVTTPKACSVYLEMFRKRARVAKQKRGLK